MSGTGLKLLMFFDFQNHQGVREIGADQKVFHDRLTLTAYNTLYEPDRLWAHLVHDPAGRRPAGWDHNTGLAQPRGVEVT